MTVAPAPAWWFVRTVTLEEHYTVPELVSAIPPEVIAAAGWVWGEGPGSPQAVSSRRTQVGDLGEQRLAAMDAAGIDVQVLSLVGPGADILPGADGVAFARGTNDTLARAVAEHPDRYAGFAHLPMLDPAAAADELDRAVSELGFVGALINGTSGGRFLDHPSFTPLLDRFEALDVPLYLHPGIPPAAVREAYYSGLRPAISTQLSQAGYGWHAETAVHVLRMVLNQTFDDHPRLRVIIGHMGETLPMMLARTDQMFALDATYLERPPSQVLREQVWVTTSGMFTNPPLRLLLDTFGIDRVMFSIDYPLQTAAEGRAFLDGIDLAPGDVEKIAHITADRLLGLHA